MKVQDVKKECLATTGLSVEFSNSEVGSLSNLLWNVSRAVEDSVERAHQMAVTQQQQFEEDGPIPAFIDLKSLKRVEWLLIQLTRRDMSGLFDYADSDYRTDCNHINNIPAVKQ